MMLATYSLWLRELLRFLRRPNCSLGALALPAILYFGADSLRAPAFTLIGSVTIILALVAAIDDPASEFLQGVKASPAPRVALVLGKALAGVTLALINVLILVLLTLLRHP
jgi:ABC-2 type transport system permease protein